MRTITSSFTTRSELTTHLLDVLGHDLIDREGLPSPIIGSIPSEEELALHVRPSEYSRTRNFYDGAVTRLSPYIRHGLTKKPAIANLALRDYAKSTCEKFLQELAWGEFWKVAADQLPFDLWTDIEPYKTGFEPDDYADELPTDIANARTPNACINHFIKDLTDTGYVHNHARMYLAAYVVHFRRVKWQAGARWFMTHLLDADIASNNLSWQWVASTFSHKPYIFNLDNVDKYCGRQVNCAIEANPELAGSYEALTQRLFRGES
jgi:deoxyribodipyrimidine photo-lyase